MIGYLAFGLFWSVFAVLYLSRDPSQDLARELASDLV